MMAPLFLADLSLPALTDWMAAQGQPAFRARQVYRQLYHGLAEDFSQMTDLPIALRDRLGQTALLNPLRLLTEQVSSDGQTRKALFELPDGQTVETVLMLYGGDGAADGEPAADGAARKRPPGAPSASHTQAGCAMGCAFCATGRSGFAAPPHRRARSWLRCCTSRARCAASRRRTPPHQPDLCRHGRAAGQLRAPRWTSIRSPQ